MQNCLTNNLKISPSKSIIFAQDIFDSFIFDNKNNIKFTYNNVYDVLMRLFSSSPYKCSATSNQISINYDGSIYPCHRFVDYPYSIIGDIYTGYDTQPNHIFENLININLNCKSCDIKDFCGGPCLVEISKTKDINYTQHEMCLFYKHLFYLIFKYIAGLFFNNKEKYTSFFSTFNKNNAFDIMNNNQNITKREIRSFQVFIKKKNVKCIDLGEEGIIYSEDNFTNKYICNITMMAIWDMLDDVRSAKEIAESIAFACNLSIEIIENDIYDQLATLHDLGFIDFKNSENFDVQ